MKALKIGAIVLGVLLLIVLVVGGIAVASLDKTRLVAELSRVVKEKKQRTLRIDGAVELSVFPRLGVKLGKVALSEHGSEAPFAAIESARVSVQLLPLLRKSLIVDRIDIEGANARLVRHRDGTLNIADLLVRDKEPSPVLQFDIAGIRVGHSAFAWQDEATGRTFTLSDFNLDTDRIANAAHGKLALNTRLASRQPQGDVALELAGAYDYDLADQRFTIDGLDAKLKGELAGWQSLDLTAQADRLSFHPAQHGLWLEKLKLSAKGKTGADGFDATLDAPALALTPDKSASESISVKAGVSGPQRKLDAKLTVLGLEGDSEHLKAGKLALEIDAKLGETAIKGGLAAPLTASLNDLKFELLNLAGSLDVTHPRMPAKPMRLPLAGELRADLKQGTAEGEIATRFDESQIQARFNLTQSIPPTLGFQIEVDKLNVDRYLPVGEKAASGGQAGSTQSPQRIDLSALKRIRLNGHVSIGSLQYRNMKASKVALDIKATDGRLQVAPHSASLYEGSVTGSLTIDANRNAFALRENLSGVNVGPLLKDVAGKDTLQGKGNIALDIGTHGDSVDALKRALDGSAHMQLRDGALKGINLAQSLREIKARLSGGQDVVKPASNAESTDFSELSASFVIANGIAHNDDLMLKSPYLRLSGSGDIDLGHGTMNYLAKASVVASASGQGGQDLEALKGLSVPVRVSGPLAALSYRIEVGSLVQDAAKAKIQETQQQLKQKTEDRLKEKLKGLLGR